MNDLTKMSDAELEAYNCELGRAREAIRADQLKIRDEFDRRARTATVDKVLTKLSPSELEQLKEKLGA